MTTDGVSRRRNRQRVERRAIPPFGDGIDPNGISNILDNILAKCRFAPFEDLAVDEQDTHFLSIDDTGRAITPQFEILVDRIEELGQRLDIQRDDLAVGLSIRSRYMRRYEVLERWDMDSVPAERWSPDPANLEKFQCGRGMDFILGIQVASNRKPLIRQGLGPGKIICRKVFSVRVPVDNFSFPFQWAKFGGDTGYPEEALWVIEWDEPDDGPQFDRPVDQALKVLANEKAEASLRAMGSAPGGNELAWRMLGAEITTQIWADVLTKTETEPDKEETDTLLGQVFARLSRASGLSYPVISRNQGVGRTRRQFDFLKTFGGKNLEGGGLTRLADERQNVVPRQSEAGD